MNLRQAFAATIGSGMACGFAILLNSCSSTPTTTNAPVVPGAVYVGNKTCAECHTNIARWFPGSAHSRIHLASPDRAGQTGCESCHGAGSLHVAAGGGRNAFIVNPGRDPSSCFECHRNVQAEFRLPQHHPVLELKMSCANCHDPHGADIFKPAGGLAMARANQTCAPCHRDQARAFAFEHPAMREGCVTCHSPHGSISAKLLIQRDANLCLRCHAQVQGPSVPRGGIYIGAVDHTSFLRLGACWSSGCHTAVHGSNVDVRLRY